jgi:peptide/nickel transport system substrate-binding protein
MAGDADTRDCGRPAARLGRRWSRTVRRMATLGLLASTATAVAVLGGASSAGAASPASSLRSAAPIDALTVGFPSKVITLDPDQGVDTTSLAAIHLIAGTLYEIRAAGTTVPGLASSGKASADGLTWTFTLRPNLKFSDGSPLTSKDVKATMDRALTDKANIYAGLFAPIKSVAAPTPTKVVFTLNDRYPSLPTILAEPVMMIMPAAGITKGKAFYNAPISAGPYKLVSWGGGVTLKMAVNSSYWGPKPVAKSLTFTTVSDFNTRVAQVRSGQLDLAVDLPPSLLPQLKGSITGKGVSVYGYISVIPNNRRAPFNNVGVRKAISKVLDRKKINQNVWGGQNPPIAGFWPSDMTGYDSSIPTAQNIAGAKADLKGTPCEKGCSTTLAYDAAFAWTDQEALIVQDNLKQIGINARLQKVENATFVDQIYKGKFDMAISALYDYANIPDGMLAYGLTKAGGLFANYSGYSSPAMDAAAEAVVRANVGARKPLLAKIETLFAKDQPYANVSNYVLVIATRRPANVVTLVASGFIEVGRSGG